MQFWEAIWKSILLGTVQGLTEFLPVSSSGHLSLLQRALGYSLEGGSMTFINIMLHFGTLIAVVIAFRKDIFALFRPPFRRLLMLAVATVPAGIVGFLFEDRIDALFAGERGVLWLSLCFGVTAVLLLACELVATRRKAVSPFGWRNAVPMGLIQAVAILPGVSRSGSTIAAGVISGGDVGESSKFSFLMSIPVILGSFVLGLKQAIFDEPQIVTSMGTAGIVGMLLGIAAAAVSGYVSIKLMLKLVAKANYKWFALYLLLLSLSSLWLNAAGIL